MRGGVQHHFKGIQDQLHKQYESILSQAKVYQETENSPSTAREEVVHSPLEMYRVTDMRFITRCNNIKRNVNSQISSDLSGGKKEKEENIVYTPAHAKTLHMHMQSQAVQRKHFFKDAHELLIKINLLIQLKKIFFLNHSC